MLRYKRSFFAQLGLNICVLFQVCVASEPEVQTPTDPVVSNLKVEFRHGQVFMIWDEDAQNDQNLRVYISNQPITIQSLSKAQLLTEQLEAHSANDWYDDPSECLRTAGPVHGWIIQPGRKPLDRSGGLFVHTVTQDDPQPAYFAVLAQNENENMLKRGVNALEKPVTTSVGQVEAIWQLQGPPPSAKGKPLVISLHSHQSRPKQLTHLFFGDASMGWREGLPFKFKVTVRPDAVLIEPYDRVWINRRMSVEEAKANGTYDTQFMNIESWWYGTNDKINDSNQISTGVPTNYTERWLLWVMNWVERNYATNPNQVYAFGMSMGTGILRMVLENPNRFASVDLYVPILDPYGEGRVGERMMPRTGGPDSLCSDGMKLRDRLDTIRSIEAAQGDLPLIVIRVGRTDKSVTWVRKPVFMSSVQEQRHGLLAGWDNLGHGVAMRGHYEGFPDWYDFGWYVERMALNKSYPAVTNCSSDDDPGNGDPNDGDITGFINRGLEWKIIADTESQYEVLLTINRKDITYPLYMDVTPRRCQKFRTIAAAACHASNVDADGKIIAEKNLVVDGGPMTYQNFAITSAAGNTLLLKKAPRK